ncbi:hypothetical protein VC290_19375 [Xanthomonas campestris]|uniref:hypothetical protein n=1 Tax=Xanthomonas campestris TaxID=339 RepID=UPI002B22BC45|nr:hypothetical protein [Xanthomonas campestris]MEA9482469.1 hypothetical protein [Xanthomonas campestris]
MSVLVVDGLYSFTWYGSAGAGQYETGINPPTEDIARRMQNLLKHLVEGAPVAQVVYEAIITGNTRHDATQLIAALRPLLQHFPTLGKNADWRARQ